MYENGGNSTHRLLDGHPQLRVYPFESQLGTKLVSDLLTSMFPVKYRWPVFPLDGTAAGDYASIIDEECKVRARTPHVSKFRHVELEMNDDDRRRIYESHIQKTGRSRAKNVEAFFRATFEAWKNYHSSGSEAWYVGYSPIVGVDARLILEDFPSARIFHIVRNPWSAYAETKLRPVPMSLDDYLLAWSVTQHRVLACRENFPKQIEILRFEDIIGAPEERLGKALGDMGLERSATLALPSWNGTVLPEVRPWGTIARLTAAENAATGSSLSPLEREQVRFAAGSLIDTFDYRTFGL